MRGAVMRMPSSAGRRRSAILAALLALGGCAGAPPVDGTFVPTGQLVTPLAAPGADFAALDPGLAGLPEFRAGQAVALAPSPDGRTLLVLTSGYNRNSDAKGRRIAAASNEYVFVYDVGAGPPRQRQVLTVPNSFVGIAWDRDGAGFHVGGGVDDDVHSFTRRDGMFAETMPPIALGHREGLGVKTRPATAGIAVSPDGGRLLVVNHENDSVSLIDLAGRRVLAELDLRPGRNDAAQRGVAGGEYPLAVVWRDAGKAYVTSQRDREIVVLAIDGDRLAVANRIKTPGQPNQLLLDRAARRLYVANDNSDSVIVVDTAQDEIVAEIPVAAPAALLPNRENLKGANPNGLALAPDERTLFVTLGGLNAVAVVALADGGAPRDMDGDEDDDDDDAPPARSRVVGLIPTGWYPNAVSVGADGRRLVVANGKSPPGANPGACRNSLSLDPAALAACRGRNQYVWQLEKAGLLSLPLPDAATLARLTLQVARNDNFPGLQRRHAQDETMAFLRTRIRHVVYVVKENRTYDQILGDLEIGDGDPALALLPERLSPNHHALARGFVTLDAFHDSGESSNTGWSWSTAARSNDFTEKMAPVNYAGRGLNYDAEGLNRLVNVGIADPAARRTANPATPDDPDLLPGTADVGALDSGADGAGAGYLWDAALRAGKTLRNFGFFGDFTLPAPLLREPAKTATPVFVASKAALAPVSDPYYRGFDLRLPDFWRIREWSREFDAMIAANAVPDLMLVRLPNDHFGSFAAALDGVGTVETQMADNDYALGLLVERIARSPVGGDTLIFVVEDDAQAGADHVDAHRSIALIAGPYVKQRALVTTRYTTVNLLRTIEEVLGLPPLGLNDGLAEPMDDVFDRTRRDWRYAAIVPEILRTTALPLPAAVAARDAGDRCAPPRHDAAFWEARMRGQDFSVEDHLDVKRFNAALWFGLRGDGSALPERDGRDLRQNRAGLLADAAARCLH
jgi:YVTN family beta-propeller protein